MTKADMRFEKGRDRAEERRRKALLPINGLYHAARAPIDEAYERAVDRLRKKCYPCHSGSTTNKEVVWEK